MKYIMEEIAGNDFIMSNYLNIIFGKERLKNVGRANAQKRDPFIDELKGIAIILVVLGHSVHFYAADYENDAIFRICYSFHMALFFVISGYLCGNKTNLDLQWLKKRAKRLLIPWGLWTVIYTFFTGYERGMLLHNLLTTPGAFWFLPCMFLCEACMLLLTSVKKYRVITWIALYGMLGFLGIGMDIPILNDVNVFLVFYFAGYLYRKRIRYIKESTLKIIAMTSSVLYIISMTTYRYGMHGAERLAIDVARYFGFQQGIGLIKIVIWANSRFVVAFLGVIAMIVNVFLIVKWGGVRFLKPVLTYLGTYTMPIYLLSGYCSVSAFSSSVNFCLSVLLGLWGPCLIASCVRKCPKLYMILFGM